MEPIMTDHEPKANTYECMSSLERAREFSALFGQFHPRTPGEISSLNEPIIRAMSTLLNLTLASPSYQQLVLAEIAFYDVCGEWDDAGTREAMLREMRVLTWGGVVTAEGVFSNEREQVMEIERRKYRSTSRLELWIKNRKLNEDPEFQAWRMQFADRLPNEAFRSLAVDFDMSLQQVMDITVAGDRYTDKRLAIVRTWPQDFYATHEEEI